MTNPIVREHNVTTGEIIDREMNAEELAELEASQAEAEAKAEAEAVKAAEKAALLAKLGITHDEAKLLLS
jgi:hypothetical protein